MVPEWSPDGWRPTYATPLEYLTRFSMQNALFDDDVRLEGVLVTGEESRLEGSITGGVSLVVSQKWLAPVAANDPHPTVEEIEQYFEKRGYEPLPDSFFGWFHEPFGILILDAKPDNFVKTPAGILPFDLLIVRCGADSC